MEGAQRTSPTSGEKVQGQSPASTRAGASSSSGNMATLVLTHNTSVMYTPLSAELHVNAINMSNKH